MVFFEQSSRQAVWTRGHPSIFWVHGALLPPHRTTERAERVEHEQGQHRSRQKPDHGSRIRSLDRRSSQPALCVSVVFTRNNQKVKGPRQSFFVIIVILAVDGCACTCNTYSSPRTQGCSIKFATAAVLYSKG